MHSAAGDPATSVHVLVLQTNSTCWQEVEEMMVVPVFRIGLFNDDRWWQGSYCLCTLMHSQQQVNIGYVVARALPSAVFALVSPSPLIVNHWVWEETE